MALFAMLAVLSSPALAFACCCGAENASVPAPPTPVASVPAPVASHPGCHGHAEADGAKTPVASADRVSASVSPSPSSPAALSAMLASSQPGFKNLCECGHAQESALSFVETPGASSFSPLVLGGAIRRYSPTLTSPSSLRFAFASNASRPRGPDLAPRSGRAPPVLSL